MNFTSVVVTGNCQAGGVSAALAALLPQAKVNPIHAWDLESSADFEVANDLLSGSDLWLRMPLEANSALHPGAQSRVLDIPSLTFPAFHPDLVYAAHTNGEIFRGINDYHSAIALWAWRHGVDPSEVPKLFVPEVMWRLNYDKYWEPSVANMRAEFANSDLAFGPFWQRLKRGGVFMHSVNHPRPAAIALLAKSIVTTIGAPESSWSDPIEDYLDDTLNHIVWPVYPPIGGVLGVPASYRWRNGSEVYSGIERWAEATWSRYGDAEPSDIVCSRIDDGVYDLVLSPYLDRTAARAAR